MLALDDVGVVVHAQLPMFRFLGTKEEDKRACSDEVYDVFELTPRRGIHFN
jgi:hypothetical protein